MTDDESSPPPFDDDEREDVAGGGGLIAPETEYWGMPASQDTEHGGTTLSSVAKSFDIIECLAGVEDAGVAELASELDLAKSTLHAHLKTLEQTGYVVNEGGIYRLSLRFLQHGGAVRNRDRLFRTAKHEVDKLATQTGEVASLGVSENGLRVLLYKSEEPDAIHDNAPVGEYTNMHWTALGKAILAHLPEARVRDIIERHGLPRANEHTITDEDELFEELEVVRQRGYSVEDQDRRQGVLTIGAPIMDRGVDEVIASVSVSGPKSRMDERHDEVVDAVQSAANVIELRYSHY